MMKGQKMVYSKAFTSTYKSCVEMTLS